ncbi:hypothetical protein CORC01_08024 [Colletotrichum orchidophilum]|uniref:SprT-like domain-containing protein n=1 Tax=Colletotrichum orchidophilum TaxID=1209926 RepID=A0A1G4B5L9_9PEZI|nr:uncharacterized protein CORC01_08024 [Colletotrichum orchidophilum]OHE96707.1 hypothetical protein CORC01_08024 [Colletotrichum orchidophilum]
MAFWVVGGEARPLSQGEGHTLNPDPYVVGGKRRIGHAGERDIYDGNYQYAHDEMPFQKRARLSHFTSDTDFTCPPRGSIPVQNLSFLVIREQTSPTPEPADADVTSSQMERTASGLSISSDTDIYSAASQHDLRLLDDDVAARLVETRLQLGRRRTKDSQHERILRSLIRPRSRHAEFSIDNAALESIFSAANEIFFHNSLSQRVTWDWSHPSSAQYNRNIIGTTALRRSKMGGFETLIVLSDPILKNNTYNRRLLISTFLHELIHSYLFIKCGVKARQCGGHTAGFRRIAELIDLWAGPDNLHLRNMEADLEDFREGEDHVREGESHHAGAPCRHSFPAVQEHLSPRHHTYHDNQTYERSRYRSQEQWDYYINDPREFFPTSRESSPISTTMTTDEDYDDVDPLEEGEIREMRGRLFLPGTYVSSRQSSAHERNFYDSYDGQWARTDDRGGIVVFSYDSTPHQAIPSYVRGCRNASPTCV